MPIYTPTEIYGFLRQAGFTPDQAQTMTAIALAESGGNSTPHNPSGEDSWGLWQINVDAHPGATGTYDPLADARFAYEVSKGGTDLSPWTVTHSGRGGRYQRFRREALAAATAYGDSSSTSRPRWPAWAGLLVPAVALLIVLVLMLGPRLSGSSNESAVDEPIPSAVVTPTSATQSPSPSIASASPAASIAGGSPSPPLASPSGELSAIPTTPSPAARAPTAAPTTTRPPTPTSPSPPPTPAPSTAAPAHTVSLSVTSPVRRGFAAAARATTTAGSRCTITVTYSSGASGVPGLDPKNADAAGGVSWSWTVPTATVPGTWPVDVTCVSPSGQRATARAIHQVQ